MLCECCNKRMATQLHHRFSQTKWAKRIYKDLIHHYKNLMRVCADCHASHASPKLEHWSEEQFATALQIEPRSKTAKARAL